MKISRRNREVTEYDVQQEESLTGLLVWGGEYHRPLEWGFAESGREEGEHSLLWSSPGEPLSTSTMMNTKMNRCTPLLPQGQV
jgi:hypothetical protein